MPKWHILSMLRGYSYRLRPTKKQKKILTCWMGACRFVYNAGLAQREINYRHRKKSTSYYEQQNELPNAKKDPELRFLADVPSQSLQMALRHLDTAFSNFYKQLGAYPAFKKKGSRDSITFPQGNRLKINKIHRKSYCIDLPKLGKVKLIQHRKFQGLVKQACVSFFNSEGWKISLLIEEADMLPQNKAQDAIGIDLGIVTTIATSETNKNYCLPIEPIKHLERRIAVIQKKKAKVTKYSRRWIYFRRIEARLHAKISRMRKDFLHKTSSELSKNHGILVMEDLRVKDMSRSASGTLEKPGTCVAQKSGLNRSILRQGWGLFRVMMAYKTSWYGSRLVVVPPRNTSRQCRQCYYTDRANRQSQSEFLCLQCGHHENAGTHAACNIRRLGLESLGCPLSSLEAPAVA